MKTKQERISNKIAALKNELANIELNRQKAYERITGVKAEKFRILKDNLIRIECDNMQELSAILNNLKPFKNGWKIDHKKTEYLTALYKIDVSNDLREKMLNISFENASGLKYWVGIKDNNLNPEFFNKFFARSSRSVSDTEHHYFGGVSVSEIRNMRVQTIEFKANHLKWYKSAQTLMCTDTIKEMINEIKEV